MDTPSFAEVIENTDLTFAEAFGSGGLDFLTPPYQSRHIARRIPGARHLQLRLGTHFVLLERPAPVVAAIEDHLAQVDG